MWKIKKHCSHEAKNCPLANRREFDILTDVLQLADEKKTTLGFAEWISQLSNRVPEKTLHGCKPPFPHLFLRTNSRRATSSSRKPNVTTPAWSLGFLAHHLAFLAHRAVCTGTKQPHGAARSPHRGCSRPDNSPAHQLTRVSPWQPEACCRETTSLQEETLHPTASACKRGWRSPLQITLVSEI